MTLGRDRSSPFWVVRRWYTARAAHVVDGLPVNTLQSVVPLSVPGSGVLAAAPYHHLPGASYQPAVLP
jgi:hypothetical protein